MGLRWHHLLSNLVVCGVCPSTWGGELFSRSSGQPSVSPEDQSGSKAAVFLLWRQLWVPEFQAARLHPSGEASGKPESLPKVCSCSVRATRGKVPRAGTKEQGGKKKSKKPLSPVQMAPEPGGCSSQGPKRRVDLAHGSKTTERAGAEGSQRPREPRKA